MKGLHLRSPPPLLTVQNKQMLIKMRRRNKVRVTETRITLRRKTKNNSLNIKLRILILRTREDLKG